MKVITLKKLVTVLFALPVLAGMLLNSVSGQTPAAGDTKDASVLFTAKCKMCHGAKAEKLFDASKPEDEMVEAILKGKKAEKPPNMPAYAEKGVDAEMAKALVAHMKSLKQ
jgi:mono/diheme cytochrome c family protein